jgi:hypothetical protein
MSIHLQRFGDRVQGNESRGLKDFTMSMTDARALHADLTKNIPNYPPYNIRKNGDNSYTIELAVAVVSTRDAKRYLPRELLGYQGLTLLTP